MPKIYQVVADFTVQFFSHQSLVLGVVKN